MPNTIFTHNNTMKKSNIQYAIYSSWPLYICWSLLTDTVYCPREICEVVYWRKLPKIWFIYTCTGNVKLCDE